MTRIAILADIHGNLPAFEAVQKDIAQVAPDRVIINGDVLNRGPQSIECLHAVRATGWPLTYGNHEDYAMKRRGPEVPEEWRVPFFTPFQQVADALTPEEVLFINALPRFMSVVVPGLPALHITHGSPIALNDGLGPWLNDDDLRRRTGLVPESILIGAHTHRPFDQRVDGCWVLNCSAVGVPYNGDPSAQYLILTGKDSVWSAEFRTVPYDREPVYAAYQSSSALDYVINHIFKYELETATFHFGSYNTFCDLRGLERDSMATFERYKAAAVGIEPGRSLKPEAPHPNGD